VSGFVTSSNALERPTLSTNLLTPRLKLDGTKPETTELVDEVNYCSAAAAAPAVGEYDDEATTLFKLILFPPPAAKSNVSKLIPVVGELGPAPFFGDDFFC
jgi:hypothetical protein